MTSKWPEFMTADLSDSEADNAELLRRWHAYDHAMKELVAKGGIHMDADGWWVETATGDMIGPDPEIEKPLELRDGIKAKPFREAFPDLAKNIDVEIARRGRPKADVHKTPVTIRLDPDVVDLYKAMGKGWQSRLNSDLRKVNGLQNV